MTIGEKKQREIQKQETKLEKLSDVSRILEETFQERKQNGAYNVRLTPEELIFVNDAVKNAILSAARSLQAQEAPKSGKRPDETLTADDFTDFKEIYREYSGSIRTTTYIFTCNIQGEPDILTYEVSLHDDDVEGFTIHTEKNDIWDEWNVRMGWDELQKLENKVKSAAAFSWYARELRRAESPAELLALQYSLWDDEDPNLTPEQRGQINERIEQKREDCYKPDFTSQNEAWIFDLTDPTERYAIYQIDDERNTSEPSYKHKDYSFVKNNGLKVKAEDYYMAFGGVLKSGETLDTLNAMFHMDRESDLMYISDVIILNRGGEVKAYYMDSCGFQVELPDFVQERQKIACDSKTAVANAKKDLELREQQKQNSGRSMRMKR